MKHLKAKYAIALFALICVNFLLHLNIISDDIQGLHSWRQSQTMWNIRNFVRHDGNILNARTNVLNGDNDNLYRYEFPIMQWTIAMVQRVLGEKIEIVRILMFMIGICAIIGMYFLIKQIVNNEFTAIVSAFLFSFSPIFYYYTFNPLPDILALSGAIWYIHFMLKFSKDLKTSSLVIGSIFLLLSTLAKLPFLMLGVISIHFFYRMFQQGNISKNKTIVLALTQLSFLLPAFLWYAWVMPTWTGNPILKGIFNDQFSLYEFIKLLGFHTVKMFPNKLLSFPVWVPFFIGVYYLIKNKFHSKWIYSLIGITCIYLLLQLTAISRDHDYYLLPFLPWLFVLVSFGIEYLRTYPTKGKITLTAICIVSTCYTVILTKSWRSLEKTSFNKDVFIYSEELRNAVPNEEHCIIVNDPSNYIFAYRIDKMGYVFKDDFLPVEWIYDLVKNYNVKYMYSDSDKINSSKEVHKYIEKTILTKGSIKIFKLKIPGENETVNNNGG